MEKKRNSGRVGKKWGWGGEEKKGRSSVGLENSLDGQKIIKRVTKIKV